jgi:hypothetical protein
VLLIGLGGLGRDELAGQRPGQLPGLRVDVFEAAAVPGAPARGLHDREDVVVAAAVAPESGYVMGDRIVVG